MRTLSETKRPEDLWPQKQVTRIVRHAISVYTNTSVFLPRKTSTRKTPKISVKKHQINTSTKYLHHFRVFASL